MNSNGDWWLGDRPLLGPGLRPPSDAALAMELGADAVLVNTAIALAQDPPLMAEAIRQGVEGGRNGYQAGRIPRLPYASASSPGCTRCETGRTCCSCAILAPASAASRRRPTGW